jgi:peroxiredoxin
VSRVPRLRRRPGAAAASLTTAVLLACAGGGFLFHQLTASKPTLHLVSPGLGSASGAAPAPAALTAPDAASAAAGPGTAAPAARPIPAELPDLALPGIDGTPHRLSDWHGKPLLVNFWATWCEPCRREIPLLKTLRRERAAEHLEVLGIALDSPGAVREYMTRQAIDYPVLIGEHDAWAVTSAFGVEAVLPFSVFADRKGRVVIVKVGELHPDEAQLILNRVHDIDSGSLGMATAREEISRGIGQLSAARARGAQRPGESAGRSAQSPARSSQIAPRS